MKLKKKSQHRDPAVISVIDEFDFSTQNDSYNKAYKKWRSNKKNPYAYNYKKNPKETVFNDSRGFENTLIASAEKRTVTRIMRTVGIAILMTIMIDSIASKLLVQVFNLLGFDIHTTFYRKGFFGGSSEVVGMYVLVSILKILIPMIYIHSKLKLPIKVELMSHLNSPVEVVNSIALTLMMCTAVSLPAAYSSESKDLFSFFMSSSGSTDASLWGQTDIIFYVIFYIIVMPIISELFFRGAIFAALRQFGDIFAIVVTSFTACILTRDFSEMPAAIIISIVASLGMLRSGTILTAFFVRIIYKMYTFALIILETESSLTYVLYKNTFMLAAFVAGAVIFITLYLIRRSRPKNYLAIYKPHTHPSKRYTTAISTFPYSVMVGICLLEAVLNFFFFEEPMI